MRVLIACELFGKVRDAFAKKGHDVTSCDLFEDEGEESNIPHPEWGERWHIRGDVLDILNWKWDLMIAFPPCTHLAVSGARWFKNKQKEQKEAIKFFMKLINAPIERIAIENGLV